MPGIKDEDLTNVPASVLKQQREADRKIKEAQEAPAQVEEDLNTVTPAPTIEEIPVVAPIVDAVPVSPAISDGTTNDGQWEHKYSVLQGKYNKEVGDLKGMVVDLKAQMERQGVVIQGLNSQQTEQTPIKSVDVDDLNPKDFEGWGDEMKTMVTTVNKLKSIIADQNAVIAANKNQPAQDNHLEDGGLQTRVESLETEINEGRITSYIKFLDDNIKGDWRALNKNAKFNAWLAVVDPISLTPRKAALTTAAENLRGSQVASIFNSYIGANGNDAGATVADELPLGDGNGGGGDLTPATDTTQEDVTKAQNDFVQGRITEEQFDKVFLKFQSTLRRQNR